MRICSYIIFLDSFRFTLLLSTFFVILPSASLFFLVNQDQIKKDSPLEFRNLWYVCTIICYNNAKNKV